MNDELEMEAKRGESDHVTARSRHAALSRFASGNPSHLYTEEAVKKERSSAPREDDGVDRHGQLAFVLGWRGPNEERKIGDTYVECVFC